MRIIGIKETNFTGKDGTEIKGKTIYTTEPLDPKKGGEGEAADKIFLSSAKLEGLTFKPAVGDTIEIFFNRYGKPTSLRRIDDDGIDFGEDH